MFSALLELVLRRSGAVFLATLALAGAGFWAALQVPIDAVPDITHPQIQINTVVPALAPEEVEKLVSRPIESEMAGLPRMTDLRSLSKFGLSQVTMTFEDGVDLYRLRQLVTERLQGALEELPQGLSPRLAPIATGLGEIFYYSLDYAADAPGKPAGRDEQLMALRQIQETQVKPLLRGTPGVAEVNTSGGYERQILIQPDPARLAAAGLSLETLAEVVRQNTRNAGGGSVEIGGEQLVVRAASRVASTDELARLPLKFAGGAQPILLGDVASVAIGAGFRTGASTEDGAEALVGAAIMLAGENTRVVAGAVRERLDHIQEKLPPGIVVRPLYDRGDLVRRTIATVETNLAEGALLVVAVLFALLGNWRAAFIVTLVIPLSFLAALAGMRGLGLSGNLMSLGAVDFGLIIDGAVVMVENIVRQLGHRQQLLGRPLTAAERSREVLAAAREVARPMFFGVLIITVVYVPILALQGIEGKMFKPMALVVMLALGGSLALALTLMPALCARLLRGSIAEHDSWLVRVTKRVYQPLLEFGLRARALVVLGTLGLFATAFVLFGRLGAEFIPQLDEGDLTLQLIRSSSAGLGASLELQKQSEALLRREFPEIRALFSRIGTAEVATDPMNPNVADTYVILHPRGQWRRVDGRRITKDELGARMRQALLSEVPGQSVLLSQPIQMRFNEIMAGSRADLICKIYGEDYAVLEELAGKVRTALATLPGGGETEFDSIGQNPMVEIEPDRGALRKFNVQAEELNRLIEIALAGEEAGSLMEAGRRIPVLVRLEEGRRSDLAALERLPLHTADGGLLTLGQVAKVRLIPQPVQIVREDTQRRVSVLVNVRGRDTAGFVAEATRLLHEQVPFPAGTYFEFAGQYQNLVEARQRLAVVVPLALALIFALIYASFGSLRQTTLIFLGVPLAGTGGVIALWLRGMPFTISAAVGFIALSGIAVLNGIMLLSFINQLRASGRSLREAVLEGTLTRLRPKLMTALVAALGFVPMALATGAGAEVQRPLATVVIGGIASSTFLTLLVVPVLYEWLEAQTRREPKPKAPQPASI